MRSVFPTLQEGQQSDIDLIKTLAFQQQRAVHPDYFLNYFRFALSHEAIKGKEWKTFIEDINAIKPPDEIRNFVKTKLEGLLSQNKGKSWLSMMDHHTNQIKQSNLRGIVWGIVDVLPSFSEERSKSDVFSDKVRAKFLVIDLIQRLKAEHIKPVILEILKTSPESYLTYFIYLLEGNIIGGYWPQLATIDHADFKQAGRTRLLEILDIRTKILELGMVSALHYCLDATEYAETIQPFLANPLLFLRAAVIEDNLAFAAVKAAINPADLLGQLKELKHTPEDQALITDLENAIRKDTREKPIKYASLTRSGSFSYEEPTNSL